MFHSNIKANLHIISYGRACVYLQMTRFECMCVYVRLEKQDRREAGTNEVILTLIFTGKSSEQVKLFLFSSMFSIDVHLRDKGLRKTLSSRVGIDDEKERKEKETRREDEI
jgi:hypothetical protein